MTYDRTYLTNSTFNHKGNLVQTEITTHFDYSYFEVVITEDTKDIDGTMVNYSTEITTINIEDISQISMVGDFGDGDEREHFKLRIRTRDNRIHSIPFVSPEDLLDMYGMLCREIKVNRRKG